jgi:hypothetical protein
MSLGEAAQLFGYRVVDAAGRRVGSIDSVWVHGTTNQLEFIGTKTGWLMTRSHVIPALGATISDDTVIVAYTEQQIRDAPSFGGDEELTAEQQDEVYRHYRSEQMPVGGMGQNGVT